MNVLDIQYIPDLSITTWTHFQLLRKTAIFASRLVLNLSVVQGRV